MTLRIQKFEANQTGRDFVCGDLHGSFSCLLAFMEAVEFDDTKDRLFAVGDLVDRGPESVNCLGLIYERWFFSCLGNHEAMMVDYFHGGPSGPYWYGNGGNWGVLYKSDPSDVGMFVRGAVEKAAQLPHIMTVQQRDGSRFHVLHAELAPGKVVLSDSDFEDVEKFQSIAFSQNMNGEDILWGRYRFQRFYNKDVTKVLIEKYLREAEIHKYSALFGPDLSHIYSGHTIMRQPTTYLGQTNLDTCAYGSYLNNADWAGLTVTEPLTGKFWLANDREVKEVQPLIIEKGIYNVKELQELPPAELKEERPPCPAAGQQCDFDW